MPCGGFTWWHYLVGFGASAGVVALVLAAIALTVWLVGWGIQLAWIGGTLIMDRLRQQTGLDPVRWLRKLPGVNGADDAAVALGFGALLLAVGVATAHIGARAFFSGPFEAECETICADAGGYMEPHGWYVEGDGILTCSCVVSLTLPAECP